MTGIGVTPFGRLFPDQATRETHVLTVRGFPTLTGRRGGGEADGAIGTAGLARER